MQYDIKKQPSTENKMWNSNLVAKHSFFLKTSYTSEPLQTPILKIKVSRFGSVLMLPRASQVIFTLIYFWSFEPFSVLNQQL